jgi:glycine/D-amino acid oxidase-like deaminating enzyme/nitrite reductase/ring-hydroxylating ferredoxin subunit
LSDFLAAHLEAGKSDVGSARAKQQNCVHLEDIASIAGTTSAHVDCIWDGDAADASPTAVLWHHTSGRANVAAIGTSSPHPDESVAWHAESVDWRPLQRTKCGCGSFGREQCCATAPIAAEVSMPQLPGRPESCWVANLAPTEFPALAGVIECDVVIIGAGIVGLTTALSLLEQGKSVVVLEARRLGRQVTGRSTAKITTQHSLIYRHLIESFGPGLAMAYAEANREGCERIRSWIGELGIACDYERKSAYAYAVDPAWRSALESEADAAQSLGLAAVVHNQAPLPFATAGALEFPDQAQFNPAKYLIGLAEAVHRLGGRIFETSRATGFEPDNGWRAETAEGAVRAAQLVMATNIAVKSPVGYANRTQPRCHAVMAFRATSPDAVDGMFIGVDEPVHSIRMGRDASGPLIIALGPRFNTGHDGDVARRFIELDHWAHEHLPVGEALWRWCNEDYDTADRMAFVGQPDPEQAPGFFVATGFNAWGISNGTAAGLLMASEIVTGTRRWGSLYDPARPAPEGFHQDGHSQSVVGDVAEIAPGEGGVLLRGKERIAVWRDEAGALHGLSAACTHKGCTVSWNNADKTWDCPCHGSVYEAGGAVIHGPTRKPLPAHPL